uniref:Retrovirus-related Pol polyprotein from transposon TNT 1-94 n=1 Tax=Cajanus cajan TaxID=3821 RepID=A0A151RUQ8_CAJCA|nr:Retrovirus-related Pol polyprotein from transposon TNT 1-94 [Cajanus cajan]
MGNRGKVPVEAIGTYCLILNTRHHLDLLETLYVPSLSRNLVSLSKLDAIGYSFTFGNRCFSLFKHNHLIGTGILCDGLYKLNLDGLYDETLLTLHHNISTKRSLVNECYAFLWHRRLSHISRERMETLIKNEILSNLDFTDLNICVDCIKGKQTKHTKKGDTRNTQLLEIVHADICGPFDVNSFRKEKYFITFIDEYSRYCYVYLLHEKSQAFDVLEIYLNEVERQLKGYMFYCPNHSMRIVETGNARFIENGEASGSTIPQKVEVKEVRMQVPLTYAFSNKVTVPLTIVSNNNEEEQHNNEPMIHNEPIVEQPQEIALRRSQREKRPAISNDYMVYLHELETDSSINENDPVSFSQAVSCDNFEKWLNAMKQ